eukprot:m.224896 g.224896  ORF g.224896 m.224896 type:complete len:1381 (-) comp33447_c3_seq1:838-4980(-)
MGIRGLTTYIRENLGWNVPRTQLPKGSTLLVDGNGWGWHILDNLDEQRREYLGDMEAVDVSVRERVKVWLAGGLIPRVVFDGPTTRMKDHTNIKRKQERLERTLLLESICTSSRQAKREEQPSLPMPPMLLEQVKWTLVDMGIEVSTCDIEADQEIAKDCAQLRDKGKPCFVLGSDSDFFMFKGIAYIPDRFEGKGGIELNTETNSTTAIVWTRQLLAQLVGIDEDLLVELAIVVGNDYTEHISLENMTPSTLATELGGPHSRRANLIVDWLLQPKRSSAKRGFIGAISEDDLEYIDFTRALYNLEDLSEYPSECSSIPKPLALKPIDTDVASAALRRLDGDNVQDYHRRAIQAIIDGRRSPKEAVLSTPTYANMSVALQYLHFCKRIMNSKKLANPDPRVLMDGVSYYYFCSLYDPKSNSMAEPVQLEQEPQPMDIDPQQETSEGHQQQQHHQIPEHEHDHEERGATLQLSNDNDLDVQFGALNLNLGKPQTSNEPLSGSKKKKTKKEKTKKVVADNQDLDQDQDHDDRDGKDAEDADMFVHFKNSGDGSDADAVGVDKKAKKEMMKEKIRLKGLKRKEDRKEKKKATKSQQNTPTSKPSQVSQHHQSPQVHTPQLQPLTPTSTQTPTVTPKPTSTPADQQPLSPSMLPIDAHREDIINTIDTHPITIIQGETGCGKSSRVPLMLLESAQDRKFVMVAQPRRIAAYALMKRARTHGGLGNKAGLRLGHGIRDEDESTILWYCTSGYLVRLIAHRPEHFAKFSHIIIDEVHERSVDADLLCYLAKRLLTLYPTIRIVLMSATIHTDLYSNYFKDNDVSDPIFVGARRFPVRIYYPSEFDSLGLPPAMIKANKALCNFKCSLDVDHKTLFKLQAQLVPWMVKQTCQPGSATLIFVAGIDEIMKLAESFEELGNQFKVFPIHSTIPFEEQLAAFDQVDSGCFKIIVATNAAESSLTLPDVDFVFCLGSHKQIQMVRNQAVLVPTCISQASATQRVGRTGRLRPGTAYRMYPKGLFDLMQPHETGEILRMPLDHVVLQLKAMLSGPVVETLNNIIEPPDVDSIDFAFESLAKMNMIDAPDDEAPLTDTGMLAVKLPVDLRVSYFLSLSIKMGIVREAIIMAAILSAQRSPFRFPSTLHIKDLDELNAVVSLSFKARSKFDQGLYSEPMMLLNVFCHWQSISKAGKRKAFCLSHGLIDTALKSIATTAEAIRKIVLHSKLPINKTSLETPKLAFGVAAKPRLVAKIRLLMLWSFPTLIAHTKSKQKKKDISALTVSVKCDAFDVDRVRALFPADVTFEVCNVNRSRYQIEETWVVDPPLFWSLAIKHLLTDYQPDVCWMICYNHPTASSEKPSSSSLSSSSRSSNRGGTEFGSLPRCGSWKLSL